MRINKSILKKIFLLRFLIDFRKIFNLPLLYGFILLYRIYQIYRKVLQMIFYKEGS